MGRENSEQSSEELLVCPVCKNSYPGENLCPDDAEYLVPASGLKSDNEGKGEFDISEEI